MTSTQLTETEQLQKAHNELRSVASRVVNELKVFTEEREVVYEGNDGVIAYHLIRGVWVNTKPGVKMMLIDDKDDNGVSSAGTVNSSSRVLMEALSPVSIHRHFHAYAEAITCIDGELTEEISGAKIASESPNQTISWEVGVVHAPSFCGLFMLRWTPALGHPKYPILNKK